MKASIRSRYAKRPGMARSWRACLRVSRFALTPASLAATDLRNDFARSGRKRSDCLVSDPSAL